MGFVDVWLGTRAWGRKKGRGHWGHKGTLARAPTVLAAEADPPACWRACRLCLPVMIEMTLKSFGYKSPLTTHHSPPTTHGLATNEPTCTPKILRHL